MGFQGSGTAADGSADVEVQMSTTCCGRGGAQDIPGTLFLALSYMGKEWSSLEEVLWPVPE